MAVKMYSTLSGKKELLKPLASARDKTLKLFVCGPTVYDFSHIGHARTYIAFDMIVKYLRSRGYEVLYLQNITDLDDKIIARAKERNENPLSLARRFTAEYLRDMRALKANAVTTYAKATLYIKEIVSQTERLIKKGYAYEIAGDGIYYDTAQFKRYGSLSGRTIQQAEDGVSRIDESVAKRNKADFCLWKFSKEGEPTWKSPWGMGRPGWHIEDTAITEKHFGAQYDIHGGARDLLFPHHEAEVAQMEAISGKRPFVRYWMHTGFLTTEGEKMSKSKGNFVTIREFLTRRAGDGARLLRFFMTKAHYRSPIDWTNELVLQAEKEIERVDEFVGKVKGQKAKGKSVSQKSRLPARQAKVFLRTAQKGFHGAMDDDFNTPKALAAIFELIREINSLVNADALSQEDARAILLWLKEVDAIFGFLFSTRAAKPIPKEIRELAARRGAFREKRQWKEADETRLLIESKGWSVEDTPSGPRLKKKSSRG